MRLPLLATAVAALIVLFAVCASNDKRSGTERPERTPRTSTAADPRIIADPTTLVATAEELGPDWKVEREGQTVTLQYSRSFEPVTTGRPGAERMTAVVSLHETVSEAEDAYIKQWGTLATATARIGNTLARRPIDPSTIQVVEITDRVPKLGANQENVYCATFASFGGQPSYVEITAAFRVVNATVLYTAFATGVRSCDGQLAALSDAVKLGQVQFQKLHAAQKK